MSERQEKPPRQSLGEREMVGGYEPGGRHGADGRYEAGAGMKPGGRYEAGAGMSPEGGMRPEEEIGELEAQALLARVMNDSGAQITIAGKARRIGALKPGVAALIAEESARIQKAQQGNMLDLMRQMAECTPSVVHCLTLAVLNDKERIFGRAGYAKRTYSKEYRDTYEQIMWESDPAEWIGTLVKVVELLNVDFFFRTTDAIDQLRKTMLGRRAARG